MTKEETDLINETREFAKLIHVDWNKGIESMVLNAFRHGLGQAPNTYAPYQACPKCNGQGTVSKPPYIAGDVSQWSSSSASFQCDVCNGEKIIPMWIMIEDTNKEE